MIYYTLMFPSKPKKARPMLRRPAPCGRGWQNFGLLYHQATEACRVA